MRNLGTLLAVLVVTAAPLAAETWTNVPVIDTNCLAKVKADPDKHPVSCALQCAKGGYGLLMTDGTYLKFDARGEREDPGRAQGDEEDQHDPGDGRGRTGRREHQGQVRQARLTTTPGAAATPFRRSRVVESA